MFLKKKVTGLDPNRTYKVTYEIDLGTHYPNGSVGIGGSPAEEGGAAGEGECRSSTVGTTTGGSSGVRAPLFPCRSVCVWVSAGTSTAGGVAPDSKRNAATDDRLIARSIQ